MATASDNEFSLNGVFPLHLLVDGASGLDFGIVTDYNLVKSIAERARFALTRTSLEVYFLSYASFP